jgi:CheY-like chemotaxis protein/anti-sigma regulatory factor (Ser/Thr protein kinase)
MSRKPNAAVLALAGLAHDIRTPLTGMLAMSDLLLASGLPERERGWALAIKDAANHLARLTTIVVDTARSGGAGLALNVEPFSLRQFAGALAQSLRARAESKSLGVDVSVPRDLPDRVAGDAVRLRSALENLIDNAVKFTERGRVGLSIGASKAGRRIRLSFEIADSGIGIVAADLKRLFKPFAQANAEVAQRFGGSGLGLAFARRVAQAMGGSLTVKSRPGRGSTFRLVVVLDAVKSEKAPGARRSGARRRLRLLCVEDNPYGRVVLNTVLGELGHDVSFAETGEAAVAAVADGGYDAVLMDVALPGIDGFETARRIRALPGRAGVTPLIGVSGRTDDHDEDAALAAGMDAYLRKPAGPATLDAALASIASWPARRR